MIARLGSSRGWGEARGEAAGSSRGWGEATGETAKTDGDPTRRWRGIIQNALVEGEFLPAAFLVILGGTTPGGLQRPNHWEGFHWEIMKEALLMSLAVQNANVACKRVLMALSKNSSIVQMVEA